MSKLSTERAIEALDTVRGYYASLTAGYPKGKDCKGIDDVTCSEIANSCLMAIEALEQESILDKIEAEIEKLNPVDYGSMFSYESHNGARDMKKDILDILDKYKAESEDK